MEADLPDDHQWIAILPQGVDRSRFGDIADHFQAYVEEVLGKVWPKATTSALSVQVVLSAHSGGGDTVDKVLKDYWAWAVRFPILGMMLFDAEGFSGTMRWIRMELCQLRFAAQGHHGRAPDLLGKSLESG